MAAKKEVTFVIRARDLTRNAFRRITRGFRSLRLGLASLIGGVGIAALTRGMLDFASSIQAASDRLDVPVEQLQSLKVQAEDAKVPFDSLVTVIQRLRANAGAAIRGDQNLADYFKELGITVDDLAKSDTFEIFERIADAVSQASETDFPFFDALRRVGDAEIGKLIPLLEQGAAGIRQETIDLLQEGRIQTREAIRAQAEAEREARRIIVQAQVAFSRFLITFLPVLERLIQRLDKTINDQEGSLRQTASGAGRGPNAEVTWQQLTAQMARAISQAFKGEFVSQNNKLIESNRDIAREVKRSGTLQ